MQRKFLPTLVVSICCLLTSLSGYSQEPSATTLGPAAAQYLQETAAARRAFIDDNAARFRAIAKGNNLEKAGPNPVINIPIQLHVLQNTSGYQAIDFFGLTLLLKELNDALAPADIQLYNCNPINYITDNALYDLAISTEEMLLDNIDAPNAMNIYFVNTLTQNPNGIGYCGSSSYPSDGNRIIYSKSCFGYSRNSVILHLIGQYFSLFPTHGNGNAMTDELVDQSNCATAGDEICDTPADPRLNQSGAMNGCNYVGTFQDANQQQYAPDVTNYMSYASGSCRTSFTPQQMERMYYSAQNDRPYLSCSNTIAPCSFRINQFPYNFGFENGLNGWQSETFYATAVAGRFLLNSGSTPTAGTGPTAAFEGNNYIYAEASLVPSSNPYVFGVATIESPYFDFSSMTAPQMSLNYHMSGPDAGQLYLQASTDGGYTWASLSFYKNGDQGNSWQSELVDLSAYANESCVKLRFGVSFISAARDVGDIAIDAVRIEDASPCVFDVEVAAQDVSCFGMNDGSADLTFLAAGTLPYTINWSTGATGTNTLNNLSPGGYTVTVTDDNGCFDVVEFIVKAPLMPLEVALSASNTSNSSAADGTINSNVTGGTLPYTYTWSNGATSKDVQGLTTGNYDLTITDANGCSTSTGVYVGEELACNGTKSGWPYYLNFDGGTGIFAQNTDDDTNWRRRGAPTPTNNTGPTTPAEGSSYRYIESSGSGSPSKTAVLTGNKCLNLSNVSSPVLIFQYHMYGSTMGTLEVQMSVDGGATWMASAWSRSGDQGDVWHVATIDLTPFVSNQTRIRIVGTTGSGQFSDMAIDDLYIGQGNVANSSLASVVPNSETKVEIRAQNSIQRLFPNPATSEVFLQVQLDETLDYQMEILNVFGQRVKTNPVASNTNQLRIDVSDLESGVYYILLRDSAGKQEAKPMVIKQNR